MKKFFSNPIVALIITILVVVASTLVNTRIRLGGQCDAMKERFYSGADAIDPQLNTLCEVSDRLLVLAGQNGVEDTDEAEASFRVLRSLCGNRFADLTTIHSAYDSVLRDCFALESALARLDLSESDKEALQQAQHEAANAKAAVDASGYNPSVRTFLNRYDRFPSAQLAKLAHVALPQLFA